MSIFLGNTDKPFDNLLDTIKTSAIKRGVENPDWVDVWTGIASTPEYAAALRNRGVSVGNFKTEVQYMAHFGDIMDAEAPRSKRDIVMRAVSSLIADHRKFNESPFAPLSVTQDEDKSSLMDSLDQFYIQKAIELRTALGKSDEDKELDEVKLEIIRHIYGLVTKQIGIKADDSSALDKDVFNDKLISQFQNMAYNKLYGLYSDNFFLSPLPGFGGEGEDMDVIAYLKDMQDSPLSSPTPVEVIDAVTRSSGFVFETLLMRNGLRARNADTKDCLADKLPAIAVQETMLQALDIAYERDAKSVTTAHVVDALLHHPSIRTHLIRLGVKDLVEMEDKFRQNMMSATEASTGKIKVHPQIGNEILDLADQFNTIVNDKGHIAEALRLVIKQDDSIRKALSKAGLTGKMLKGWEAAYDPPKDEKEVKKADDGPEITDAELEHLIADYCTDLTALARKKRYDPTIGEDAIVGEVATTLIKRGKKNVIVIGEPGTGKSAVTGPALAQAFISGKGIPEELVGARLLQIDLHQMNNSPYIGMFESRILPILKGIAERNIKRDGPPIVLQLPEFGQALNAGGHSNAPGIKGLILPYLTEGGLLVVADCTEKEYRTNIENVPALARRFETVYKEAPDIEKTVKILKGIKLKYSQHHGLRIPESLLPKIAAKAEQYIVTGNQPDKSIDLLDAACAKAKAAGAKTLEERHVNAIVSSRARVPASFLEQSETARYAGIEDALNKEVLGQEDAVRAVASAIKRSRAGLNDPDMPIGKFLFVGPTGVGKTELTKAVARHLLGSDKFITRYNMGEYGEKTAAKRFIGGDPNFVGYEEGGLLIRDLRSRPFGVYLFDEVEKAHPDVWDVLLAVLDGDEITDGRGIKADMKNALPAMTSNIGAAEVMQEGTRLGLDPIRDYEEWQAMARPIYKAAVEKHFKPEFLNRLDDVIFFNSLSPDTMKQLVLRQYNATASRLRENHNLDLAITDALREQVADKGYDVRYGARPLARAWKTMIENPMADFLLSAPKRSLKKASALSLDVPLNVDLEGLDEVLRSMKDVHQIRRLLENATPVQPRIELLYG